MENPTRSRALPRAITLIELLAIVAALVLLAVLIVPRFAGSSSFVNRLDYTRSLVEGTNNDLERFKIHCGRYPRNLSELFSRPTDAECAGKWQGPYVKRLPVDEWSTPLGYTYPGRHNPQTYDLWSFGPDRISGTADDIANWN